MNIKVSNMLINDFYANREIFITGGTGFLGKALVEKLLRSCPNVGKIFLLVRSKKGKTMNQRIEELSQDVVFERLHKERPNIFKEKLHAIAGDCFEIGLAICEDDLKKLSNVSLIFHGAANVRFDNDLENSTLMNVRGTWELVKIAETLKNLVAFIHVSTAYVNSNDMSTNVREEKIMKIPNDWRTTIKIAETMNADTLEVLRLKFTNYFSNPYSFTKTLAEQVIEDYSDRLPMVIFRPSIVVCSFREPVPGWVDNFYGPMGFITAATVGIIRCAYTNKNTILSVVPIDAVTRMTIVSAYKRGLETIRHPAPMPGLEVINCCGDIFSSVTNYQGFLIFIKCHHEQPFANTLWAPSQTLSDSYLLVLLHLLVFDIPLAATYDALLKLSKKKPVTMTILRRFIYTAKTLNALSNRKFEFKMENLLKLNDFVPESDIDEFSLKGFIPLDMHSMFYNGFCGTKKFLLKEDVISSPKTQMRYKTFLIVDKIFNFILYLIAIRLLWLFLK